jgi:hypothetical protein
MKTGERARGGESQAKSNAICGKLLDDDGGGVPNLTLCMNNIANEVIPSVYYVSSPREG